MATARTSGGCWLAYGITTVRDPVDQRRTPGWSSAKRSTPDGAPARACFVAGDPFDGARVYYPGGVSVTSDEQLERELDRASTLGIDFFKTYVRLPDRLQKQIVEFAHAQNRPVTSHELYPAVAYGIDGIEHLGGTSRRGYSPKHERQRARLSGRHRSDREVRRDADADDRHHRRVSTRARPATARCSSIRGWRCFRCRPSRSSTDMAATRPDPALDARSSRTRRR